VEKLVSLLLVVAGIAGTIHLATGPRRRHDQASIDALATQLEDSVARAADGARDRAAELAAHRRLTWIVATDEVTVHNLTRSELGLPAEPGERVQLAQVSLGAPGRAVVLAREPEGMDLPIKSPAGSTSVTAPQILIVERVAYVAAIAAIVPRDRADEVRGVLTVARAVDLGAVLRAVAALGIGARLEGGGRALGLGGVTRARPGWQAIEVPLRGAAAAAGVRLVLSVPEPRPPWGRAGAAALLLFAAVMGAGIFWTLGSARAAARQEADVDGDGPRQVRDGAAAPGAKDGFLV